MILSAIIGQEYLNNGWLKYDHRVMYKKYTTPLPHMGCGLVERHLEMDQPTTTKKQFGVNSRKNKGTRLQPTRPKLSSGQS